MIFLKLMILKLLIVCYVAYLPTNLTFHEMQISEYNSQDYIYVCNMYIRNVLLEVFFQTFNFKMSFVYMATFRRRSVLRERQRKRVV